MIAVIFIVLGWLVVAALQSAYKSQTGVDMPSRQDSKRLRQRARAKGIAYGLEHDAWVNRKRKSKGFGPLDLS